MPVWAGAPTKGVGGEGWGGPGDQSVGGDTAWPAWACDHWTWGPTALAAGATVIKTDIQR